jgi:membrane-associated protease RseP (regulator of RpoE activity)
MDLLADDVTLSQDPPGVKVTGKKELEPAIRYNITWKHRINMTGTPKVDGQRVRMNGEVQSDDFRLMGIERMRVAYEMEVSNGRIRSIRATPDASDWQRLMANTAGGIGVRVEPAAQGLKITGVTKDAPAGRAGLKPGDVIVMVDGMNCANMREGEGVLRIKGPVGSQVRLGVARQGVGSPEEVTVERADLAKLQ